MEKQEFIFYNTADGRANVILLAKDGDVWMNQNQLAELFDTSKQNISLQMFFADTQNKMLYAITGKTAAEIIVSRANADEPNMSLTNWKGNIVRKQDIYIAKNYLTVDEIDTLNRFVVVFLETAELRAKNKQDITMSFWKTNVDRIIEFNDKEVLTHKGKVTHLQMEEKVDAIYDAFHKQRKQLDAKKADENDLEELKHLEDKLKNK